MSLPGFTAEVSLGSIGRTYRAALGRSGNSDGQTVVAQVWPPQGGHCGADCLRQDEWCKEEGGRPRDCNRIFAGCIKSCPRYTN